MMFGIKYSSQALKFLKSADKVLAKRLIEKIESLQEKPVLHDTKILEGSSEKMFRVRVGSYRILYEVDHENKVIGIVKIDKRSRVY
ncbi:MAG: type II toxin-antitoxin system RelE/ParE family toxin [archaeon]